MSPQPTWAAALLSILATGTHALDVNDSLYQPRSYTINVSSSFIEETRLKAFNFRPTIDISTPAWFDGPPSSVVNSLAKYWTESYDWPAEQDRINSNFSHYMITIPPASTTYNDSLDIHFIHERSERKDAIPMLMLHGWPSSSLEWQKVIPGLINPENESTPAFHTVAPDLPGFGFSSSPTAPGLNTTASAAVFASLMQRLGYSRYVVYSTDLGFPVALKMVVDYQPRIINHITDFYIVFPTAADQARYAANETTAEENIYLSAINAWLNSHAAYSAVHTTFPLSIAHALNDSPVGFFAWIYQLVWALSDEIFTEAELITRTLLLYIPGVYGNIRAYKETFAQANFVPVRNKTVPTSVLQFGGMDAYPDVANVNYIPRDWVERTANVTYFARHDKGGHFPAESVPELVLADIRAVFS